MKVGGETRKVGEGKAGGRRGRGRKDRDGGGGEGRGRRRRKGAVSCG